MHHHEPKHQNPTTLVEPWTKRGPLIPKSGGQSQYASALTVHNGMLWCLWADTSRTLYYTSGSNATLGLGKTLFADPSYTKYPKEYADNAPALADSDGVLHAVFKETTRGQLIHYQYDDMKKQWGKRVGLGVLPQHAPTICSFQNQVFCAYTASGNNQLWFLTYDPFLGWSIPTPIDGSSWGAPALYVLEERLHLSFSANNDGRQILDLLFDPITRGWSRVGGPNEATAFGVSATTTSDYAFIGFQANNGKGSVLVSIYDQVWLPHEDPGETSWSTPAVAVLDNVLNVIFDARGGGQNQELIWIQQSVGLYNPKKWMTSLNGEKYLSQLTIPGTHDSCAISQMPFVGTQFLTITQQLDAGIRYFDLRVRLVSGAPLLYHGVYQLYPPDGLNLESVFTDMCDWLRGSSETLIVQISEEPQKNNPDFAKAMWDLVHSSPLQPFFALGNRIPQLKNVRGKIQYLRRYDSSPTVSDIGIGIVGWLQGDNTPYYAFDTVGDDEFVVQDAYDFNNPAVQPGAIIETKFGYVNDLLLFAGVNAKPTKWFINCVNTTQTIEICYIGRVPITEPHTLAVGYFGRRLRGWVKGSNTRVYEAPIIASKGHYGVLLFDFPGTLDADLVLRLIQTNAL